MSSDPNKKSARSFQCRDVLWETFEQMARELECSVDYLINEAMKQYARQRSYGPGATRTPFPGGREPQPSAAGFTGSSLQGPSMSSGMPTPAVPGPPQMRGPGPLPPPPSARMPLPPPGGRPSGSLPIPPPRGMTPGPVSPPAGRPSSLPTPPPPPMGHASRPPPPPGPSRSVPPPIPGGRAPAYNGYAAPAAATALSVIYQGEKSPVNKERFVIGRGKQSSDLTLKDPNVSRQHAMIEFQNGVYFMVDMGSTNGVEYNGQRIARKQIAEGDVFRICDHDLRFTYR